MIKNSFVFSKCLIFFAFFVCSTIIMAGESMPGNGAYGYIVKTKGAKALLAFKVGVTAEVGQIYKTSVDGLFFKVADVSPGGKRMFGLFNKKGVQAKNKIFLFNMKKILEENNDLGAEYFVEKKVRASIFYAISLGSFKEEVKASSAESSQNSPFTLGGSLNYKISKSLSYSGSLYFSKLNSAMATNLSESSTSTTVDIPWEYGLTSYLEYSGLNFFLKPYVGVDYESFSTFNTDELNADGNAKLDVRTHSFFYGTFGVFSLLKIFSRPGIFKASVSTNLTSTSSRKSTVSDVDFSGQKFIIFLGTNIIGNWGASAFYKQHLMSGPTDLSISRFGLGISYNFN